MLAEADRVIQIEPKLSIPLTITTEYNIYSYKKLNYKNYVCNIVNTPSFDRRIDLSSQQMASVPR